MDRCVPGSDTCLLHAHHALVLAPHDPVVQKRLAGVDELPSTRNWNALTMVCTPSTVKRSCIVACPIRGCGAGSRPPDNYTCISHMRKPQIETESARFPAMPIAALHLSRMLPNRLRPPAPQRPETTQATATCIGCPSSYRVATTTKPPSQLILQELKVLTIGHLQSCMRSAAWPIPPGEGMRTSGEPCVNGPGDGRIPRRALDKLSPESTSIRYGQVGSMVDPVGRVHLYGAPGATSDYPDSELHVTN